MAITAILDISRFLQAQKIYFIKRLHFSLFVFDLLAKDFPRMQRYNIGIQIVWHGYYTTYFIPLFISSGLTLQLGSNFYFLVVFVNVFFSGKGFEIP